MNAIISDLHWYSDWNGYEVGYPEVDVVGMYHSEKLGIDMYIDTSTSEVLEVFNDREDE